MAIGTAAAIGLGVAGVGSALGAKSSSKAASKAADTSLAVAQQNNALTEKIYNQNAAALSPYMTRGNAAGDQINALLGLGGGQQSLPTQQPNALATADYGIAPNDYWGGGISGANSILARRMAANNNQATTYAPQQTSPQTAENAFDVFRNSTGYQFRLGEGMNALNSGYAGSGILQSGDALRAAQEYGQNFASNEFGNYMGYLSNQQGVGLAGTSALAGVGQNYVNNVSANNRRAGDAAANAYLIKGQNNPFANALGVVGGGLLGGL